MLHRILSLVFITICLAAPLRADGEKAGEFDYYVLSLSWSPTWCALEGRSRNSPQCDADKDFGWVLHGLWPQYERGYPSYCPTARRAPPRSMTAGMEDIMGAPGVAWYQWKKHGTCAGLEAGDYYRLARLAFDRVKKPEVFRKLTRDVRVPASVVEEAFIEANPNLTRDMITITCKSGRIQEARVCLTRELEPRRCGGDVIYDCRAKDALLDAID
ncbi:ribonuclease T [Oceanicola sp. 22II-s10i]|uniref:ribonuclease T2 family protein n=1 Tax=Oceanicola sp. 22II-s10i TaxID=1317116 RepID=UPI000B520231|nr:ribonuclease T2 [Oceanicola sp. 22II-s10i]OWU86478.1 ribonuclease T [Oceanicola sp. 22II-s10i]